MSSDFTLLNVAAGRPLKWPTFLAISADSVLTHDESNDGDIQLTLMDEHDNVMRGTITVAGDHVSDDGAYLLRQAYVGTDPLHFHVGQDGCIRSVPEEFDDPTGDTLPWAPSLLSGIGVVAEVNESRKKGLIRGLSFLGKDKGWRAWELRTRADDASDDPLQQIPRPLSLVSFHAALHRVGRDGILEAKLHRIAYLQPAYSLLLGQLGITPGRLGRDRAIAVLQRLNEDFSKVQRMVNADEDSSEDSIDTPPPAKELANGTEKDCEERPEKRARADE
ncbi:hypothetical protein OC834_006550 [Tilletia horrida]|uniref:Uncharacterized protein n=1 Tax=Tilletia horrida TaxID=155126 RepID=A0AAN6GIS3_9BASI|nr:hypothetical protein OC834_006550 [Tilletia horrida]KAK0539424.1 hypothetical protein OC842_000981 [Tilletia horrida]KAK0564460.1 hypothetical protein OC844_001720 [Tilletia horrida]